MPTITIDNTDYDLDTLSDAAKAQIANLQTVDRRIAGLQEELAIHQTARIAYANALKSYLPGSNDPLASQISWPES